MMKGFVMSIEALATLVMALGAVAIMYAAVDGGTAAGIPDLINEMQAHDAAWVVGSGISDGAELGWLADGLDACMKVDGEGHGAVCAEACGEAEGEGHGAGCTEDGNGRADVFAAGATVVKGAGYRQAVVRLEKH